MQLMRHTTCGARILSDVRHDGIEYVLAFIVPDSMSEVSSCPACGRRLETALAFGELADEGRAP